MSKVLFVALWLPLAACGGRSGPGAEPGGPSPVTTVTPEATTSSRPHEPMAAPAAAAHSADLTFIAEMIPHHQGAVEMAKLARERAEHAEIKTLAAKIVTAQEAEIAKMEAWRQQWSGVAASSGAGALEPVTAQEPGGMPEMADKHAGMPEMADEHAGMPEMADEHAGMPEMADKHAEMARMSDKHSDMPEMSHADLVRDLETLKSAKDFDLAFLDTMVRHHQMGIDMAEAAKAKLQHPETQALASAIAANQAAEITQMNGWREAWFPTAPPAI